MMPRVRCPRPACSPSSPPAQSYVFRGGYVQLAYTFTGENRSYDKRLGRLDSYYFGRQGNFNNAWFVRDEDGRLNFSMGAVEIAARSRTWTLTTARA